MRPTVEGLPGTHKAFSLISSASNKTKQKAKPDKPVCTWWSGAADCTRSGVAGLGRPWAPSALVTSLTCSPILERVRSLRRWCWTAAVWCEERCCLCRRGVLSLGSCPHPMPGGFQSPGQKTFTKDGGFPQPAKGRPTRPPQDWAGPCQLPLAAECEDLVLVLPVALPYELQDNILF